MNSIANLLIHLSGNLCQWIISGIGGAADIRNRPAEFTDRSRRSARELLAILRDTVRESDKVLSPLRAGDLAQPRRIQGFDETVVSAALHSIAHFRGHSQEIIHLTRTQLGSSYRYDFIPKGEEQESVPRRS